MDAVRVPHESVDSLHWRSTPAVQRAFFARIGVLGGLTAAIVLGWALSGGNEETAQVLVVLALFIAAPFLAWFVVQPEPSRADIALPNDARSWLRFPFVAGGAGGAVFFVLCLAFTWSVYVLGLGISTGGEVWLADDDPVQLLFGCLYACVYVLLPIGVFLPLMRGVLGRILAIGLAIGWTCVFTFLFPRGAHDPHALSELGSPLAMITVMKGDGSVMPYARDDVAMLTGLALLGMILHVPRVVRRWRELRG